MKETSEFLEEVEIEELGKRGMPVPAAKRYIIRIDKERKVVETPTPTGRQILALVNKTPETFKLYQHVHGAQPVQIAPDQVVDLRAPGVERFTTMPRDTTEGAGTATDQRRQFRLPADDEEALNAMDLTWETVRDGTTQWLLIHAWQVPPGYTHKVADVALLIPPGYPDSQIDMVYFNPALVLASGKNIRNLSVQPIAGQTWQRWSRHRTSANPWRIAVDDVTTHLTLVDEWLKREL